LNEVNVRLIELDARLQSDFPDYAEIAVPQPLVLSDAQALLGPDEALFVYVVGPDETYLWVVRRDQSNFHRVGVSAAALEVAVRRLRASLDLRRLPKMPAFDLDLALSLYHQIFAPAEPLLEGVRHVMVVPDGALMSLPLGVLVTDGPVGAFKDLSGRSQVPWLARKYAMSVLPSVSSLRALRRFARAAPGRKPFVGFGDPLFDRGGGEERAPTSVALFTRGPVADVALLRRASRLPNTAKELRLLASALGAREGNIYLRERATEARVRTMDLSPFRVIAFSTHGLVAGDLEGFAEPGLLLTPPTRGTEADDGVLTASEIARDLKLNADLVILSACNTAAPDGTPRAEGFSGLTKAFLYAGSRALLVSHWIVESESAARLTTQMIAEAGDDPSIGYAEALRRSMLALMDEPKFAHPLFWAPFVLVGEGGIAN
jgi:CHAT domain-containing protein